MLGPKSVNPKSPIFRSRGIDLLISTAIVMFVGELCGPCLAEGANSPKLFAPGIVSGPADKLSPAFAPDGKTVYFTRANASGAKRPRRDFQWEDLPRRRR